MFTALYTVIEKDTNKREAPSDKIKIQVVAKEL